MNSLILVKKINILKKLEKNNYLNIAPINLKIFKLKPQQYKYDLFNFNFITRANYNILVIQKSIINYNKLLFKIELTPFVLHFLKLNNILYSNYDLSMVYSLAFRRNAASINYRFRNKNYILRAAFRAGNYKLSRKIASIDIILKKYLELYLHSSISLTFERYLISFRKKNNIFLKF